MKPPPQLPARSTGAIQATDKGAQLPAIPARTMGIELRTPAKQAAFGMHIDPLDIAARLLGTPTLSDILKKEGLLVSDGYSTVGDITERVYTIDIPPGKKFCYPLKRLGGDLAVAADQRGRPILTVPLGLADDVRPHLKDMQEVQEDVVQTPSGRSVAFQLKPKAGHQVKFEVMEHKISLKILGWK
ncbi:MAG TPA: hypothetical protein PKW90_03720 [Myxococcota bacterium]|nr:hypothetical protein [Myxococcota bacterium]